MFNFIKNIISPKKCYSCGKEGHFLCEQCFEKIERKYFFDEICYVCKKYSKNFEVHETCKKQVFYDKTIILTHYKIGVIKKMIKDFKFYNKKDISEDFGELLVEKMIKYISDELKTYRKQDFVVISAPMSFFRKLKRGYNHSEVLAKYIAGVFGFKFEKTIIKKIKNTRQQSKLKKEQRLKNLDNSFKINKTKVDIIDKKIIILVDDIISTGTTVNEISRMLKNYNPKKIIVVNIASGL